MLQEEVGQRLKVRKKPCGEVSQTDTYIKSMLAKIKVQLDMSKQEQPKPFSLCH